MKHMVLRGASGFMIVMLLLIVGYLLGRASEQHSKPSIEALAPAVSEQPATLVLQRVEKRLDILEKQQAQVLALVNSASGNLQSQNEEPTEDEYHPPPEERQNTPLSPEQQQMYIEQKAAFYDEFLDSKKAGVSEAWAIAQEQNIAQSVDVTSKGTSTLLDIDCGETVCRFEVAHNDEQSQMQFSETFWENAPEHRAAWVVNGENGTSTRVYLFQEDPPVN